MDYIGPINNISISCASEISQRVFELDNADKEIKKPSEDLAYKYVVYDGNFRANTKIFSTFIQQVVSYYRENALEPIPVEINELLDAIQSAPADQQRELYDELLKKIDQAPVGDASFAWARDLAYALCTKGNILAEQKTFLLSLTDYLVDDSSTLSQQLLSANERIRATIQDAKNKGTFQTHCRSNLLEREDLMRHGFLPNVVFETGGQTYLSMPRPYDRHLGNGYIGPVSQLFRHHLHALQIRGEKQLYISLLNRTDSNLNEVSGCNRLEDLAREFSDALFFVVIDVKSSFYQQFSEETLEVDAFKLQFERHIEMSGAYHFGDLIGAKELSVVMDQVHGDFFQNRDSLTQSERRAFIDLFNGVVVDEIAKKVAPTFVNASCAYTKDRGPAFYATKFFRERQVDGELSSEDREKFLSMILVSAPISHMSATSQDGLKRVAGVIEAYQVH